LNPVAKLGVFAVVLSGIFGGAVAVGKAVGPIHVGGVGASHSSHNSVPPPLAHLPQGLAVAENGYRLALDTVTVKPGSPKTFDFRILDPAGRAVTHFDLVHGRPLDLIVLSRNLVDYFHLHPTMDITGRWTVAFPALQPGSYRVFTDFQPTAAEHITLASDVTVPGNVEQVATPTPSSIATVDGYEVALAGEATVGASDLRIVVQLAGKNLVTDAQLMGSEQLIAVRIGDLAYIHEQPTLDPSNPVFSITVDFPTSGAYRLFFEFSRGGTSHTAAFTVIVPDGSMKAPSEGH
jgi:hypothetical protein